jgi:hypothetical protein
MHHDDKQDFDRRLRRIEVLLVDLVKLVRREGRELDQIEDALRPHHFPMTTALTVQQP